MVNKSKIEIAVLIQTMVYDKKNTEQMFGKYPKRLAFQLTKKLLVPINYTYGVKYILFVNAVVQKTNPAAVNV